MTKKNCLIVILTGASLYFVFRNVNLGEVASILSTINPFLIIASMLCIGASFVSRSMRWKVLSQGTKNIPVVELFELHAVSFMTILLFPFRLGEFTRPFLLKTKYEVPFTASVTMLVVERIFDAILAATVLFVGISGVSSHQEELSWMGMNFSLFLKMTSYLLLGAIFLIFFLIVSQKYIFKYLESWSLYQSLGLASVSQSLSALPNLKSCLLLFFYSAGVWLPLVLGSYFSILAFHLEIPWSASFCVVGLSTVGMVLPGPPAGIGLYQFFVQTALALYGVEKSTGLAFSLVTHVASITYTVVAGLACLPRMSVTLSSLYLGLKGRRSSPDHQAP